MAPKKRYHHIVQQHEMLTGPEIMSIVKQAPKLFKTGWTLSSDQMSKKSNKES